jgi:ATP-dependent helicase HrpA
MRAQLIAMIPAGFVTATGTRHLGDLPRYLRAIELRLERLPANPTRDRDWMRTVTEVSADYADLVASLPPQRRSDPDVREIRWMVEELRVSFFAQELRTPYPVSDVRVYKAIDAIG